MANIEEINKAIAAHGMWKARLQEGIRTGKLDLDIESVRSDHRCAFGTWLDGPTLSAADRGSEHFVKIKTLHAEFHQVAARIAECVQQNRISEAERLMGINGQYADISSRLTSAMMAWKKALAQK